MYFSNITVYNSNDIEHVYNNMMAMSKQVSHNMSRHVEMIAVEYSPHGKVDAYYSWNKSYLCIKLPRVSHLINAVSPLEVIANAAVDYEGEDNDEDYCLLLPLSYVRALENEMLSCLYRVADSNFSLNGARRIRYCKRLRRGQAQAQSVGRFRYEIECKRNAIVQLSAENDSLLEQIRIAEKWTAERNAKAKSC